MILFRHSETWTSSGEGLLSPFLPILIPNPCVFSYTAGVENHFRNNWFIICYSPFEEASRIANLFIGCTLMFWIKTFFPLELGFCSWKVHLFTFGGNSLFRIVWKCCLVGDERVSLTDLGFWPKLAWGAERYVCTASVCLTLQTSVTSSLKWWG